MRFSDANKNAKRKYRTGQGRVKDRQEGAKEDREEGREERRKRGRKGGREAYRAWSSRSGTGYRRAAKASQIFTIFLSMVADL
jgi:hypothetical protein